MGLQVAAAGKIINEFTGLAFAGGEFETDNPAIRFVSAEAWTKDAQGAHIVFATAPIGSSSPVEGMRLTSEGILLVGTDTASGSAKLQVSGAISVSGITYAGTLALSATGANPITFSSGGTEGFRLAPTTRNLLVGTTTDDGASKLQVAGTVNIANTARLQFADVAHSINYLNSAGGVDGLVLNGYGGIRITTGYGGNLAAFGGYSSGAYHSNTLIGGTTNGNYRLDVQSSGSSGTLRVYDQTATTGVTSFVLTEGAGQGASPLFDAQSAAVRIFKNGRTDVYLFDVLGANTASGLHFRAGISGVANGITLYQTAGSLGAIKLDPGTDGLIGFFGATPVVKQTVTADAASILAALQAYGLAV